MQNAHGLVLYFIARNSFPSSLIATRFHSPVSSAVLVGIVGKTDTPRSQTSHRHCALLKRIFTKTGSKE